MKAHLLCALLLAANLCTASALEDPPPRNLRPAHLATDAEIQSSVVRGIVANPEVFAAKLRAKVSYGFVTLYGTVRSPDAKVTAGKIAKAVPGVRGVTNLLVVRPKPRRGDR